MSEIGTPIWEVHYGQGPLVATAIHDGHEIRPELLDRIALPEQERLREEDPFTRRWTVVAPTRIIGRRSRFEVDLNRPREKAIYLTPEDAWGLQVWKEPLQNELVERSLGEYDDFYANVHQLLSGLVERHGRVVVFDIHTYNHRRNGPTGPVADAEQNPEVNVGTGTMDRQFWAPIVDRFITSLSSSDFLGRRLDVRENVKFRGGNFPRWIHEHFPRSVCAIAIEFKKFFMDEWTGTPDEQQIVAIERVLRQAAKDVLQELSHFA